MSTRQTRKRGSRSYPPAIERVLAKCVEDQAGCWLYTGVLDPKGYVRLRGEDSRKVYGHRVTWCFFVGEWPEGLTYDHLCRVKNCVNPWHGDPVPAVVNSRRSPLNRGVVNAAKTHCPEGHPLSGDNLRFTSAGRGRVCKTCRAVANAKYRVRAAA